MPLYSGLRMVRLSFLPFLSSPSYGEHRLILLELRRTAIIAYLSLLLTRQKKLDFKPKNDDDVYSRLNTEPCILACEFLTKVREATGRALTGRNAEVFLTEVGVTFHTYVKSFPFPVLSFSIVQEISGTEC
jgi:hypothetical protein